MAQVKILADVMTKDPVVIETTASLIEAQKKMTDLQSKHLPVYENRELKGIISDRDIGLACRYLSKEAQELTVESAYVRFPYCREPDTPLEEVLKDMIELNIGSALAVESGVLKGIFTVYDACSCLMHLLQSNAD